MSNKPNSHPSGLKEFQSKFMEAAADLEELRQSHVTLHKKHSACAPEKEELREEVRKLTDIANNTSADYMLKIEQLEEQVKVLSGKNEEVSKFASHLETLNNKQKEHIKQTESSLERLEDVHKSCPTHLALNEMQEEVAKAKLEVNLIVLTRLRRFLEEWRG